MLSEVAVFLLFFSQIACITPIWDDVNGFKAISNLTILSANYEQEAAAPINQGVRFDGVRFKNDNGTGTFDFWSTWSYPTDSYVPSVLFRVSDSNNWIIISAGTLEGRPSPSLVYSYHGRTTTVNLPGPFPTLNTVWYHVTVALKPSLSDSYIKVFRGNSTADDGPSMTVWFSTFPFYGFTNPNNVSVAIGLDEPWATQKSDNFTVQPSSMDCGGLRMWNTFMTQRDMDYHRFAFSQGDEANLEHNWLFGPQSVTDVIANVSKRIAPSWLAATFSSMITSATKAPAILFYRFDRNIPYDGALDVEVSSNQYPSANSGSQGVLTLVPYPLDQQFTGPMCVFASNGTCGPIGKDMNQPTTLTTFRFRTIGTRSTCGVSFNFSSLIHLTQGVVSRESNLFYINVNIGSFNLTDNIVSVLQPDTTGGIFTITGQNFGLDGDLVNGESVIITTNTIPEMCLNPRISNGGTTITCSVGQGKGIKQSVVTFSMCKKVVSRDILFGYQAPEVTQVTGIASFTKLSIVGTNFSPNSDGVITTITNSTHRFDCKISEMNHTNIFCEVDTSLANLGNYTANVTVGNQIEIVPFLFQICTPACVNGGTCTADGKCVCSKEFRGISCEVKVVCDPPCRNGECLAGRDSNYCKCPNEKDYLPETCARKVSDLGAGAIVGIVLGGAVLIVIGVSIAYFVIKRTERREGANFVPLDKKDFTKIIYGEQLNQVPEKGAATDFKDLERLLVEDENLELAFAISNVTQITDADRIAKAMIVVFQENNRVIKLLEDFVTHEVQVAESAGTLFRANSMVSKMFKFYSRLIGLPYLYVTIGPELGKLIEEELGLEVDPEKMEEGRDLDEMRWALMSQSQKILKQILISEDACPPQFRRLFAHISETVGSRFPDNINTTIGGFVFLRLFCPAVSSPEAYGIVEEPPSADARRLLILITKVMQNLSNDVEFGSKEPYMTKMNDFIQSNRQKLTLFYEKLLKAGSKPDVPCEVPRNIKPISLTILAEHLKENLDSIENEQLVAKLKAVLPNL